MAELAVRAVTKWFGTVQALREVSVLVPAGSITAVLGPSGCGKTTLLRCVAGFERVDSGEIAIDGRAVTGVPAHRRRVAVVPQDGALFPHLSVLDNVAYGLSRAERRSDRVDTVLAMVGLTGYQRRMPHELSGGQQQRVAVARAMAPRPPLLLLDEPFAALDATLRHGVRREIIQALRADGATAVLVTHDQSEALSIADRVAVMRGGVIIQYGPPGQVYSNPADPWVASFVGDAVFLPARVEGSIGHTALGALPLAGAGVDPASGPVAVVVRPEQLELLPATDPRGVAATVVERDFHGHDTVLRLRLGDGQLVAARVLATQGPPGVDSAVRVRVHGPVRAYPADRP